MKLRQAYRFLLVLSMGSVAVASIPTPSLAVAGPVRGGVIAPSDFNGDGFSDLAVGVLGEASGGVDDTGAINVLYATDTGLDDVGNQFWDQTSTGSATNGTDDGFGFASASGDFNGDGFADAAVGVPFKDVGGVGAAGAVSVLYGSVSGLAAAGSQQWTQNSTDVEDDAETEDNLGFAVAAGDFNGDGFDDLASGIPGEIVGGKDDAGAVSVLYGSISGLTATGDQRWTQNSTNINNKAETLDQLGLAVGTGDFNGDGFADLAVGVPTENLDGGEDGGAVNVIYGSVAGLTSAGDDFWHQDVTDINNSVKASDLFGYFVTGGDFDGDGFDDLLTSVVGQDISGQADAGGVSAIYGSASGLAAAGDDFWHQDSGGISNEAEVGDQFGAAIATGDFDGDGFADAAMGVIGEDVSGATDSGGVAVIYGTSGGLDDPNDDFWHQDSTDIEDQAEEPDLFGYSLVAASFGNGPEADLAIGAVLETVGGVDFAGAVNVIYGSPSDLISTGDQFWNQDSTGILDTAEAEDWFGFALGQPAAGAGPSGGPLRGWSVGRASWVYSG
jgi:hypothetical protein